MQSDADILENNLAVLQIVRHWVTIWPSSFTLGIYPKEMKTYSHTKTCMSIFTIVLFIVARKKKQFKCPSADEKAKCGIAMQYYLVMKKNKVLIHAFKHGWNLKTLC